MYKLMWILPFKVNGEKLKLHNVVPVNIFDKNYFAKRALSLSGSIYRIYEETLSFDLYTDWKKPLTLYRKYRELKVDIDKIKNMVSNSKVSVRIYVATKWNIGIIFLTLTITNKLSSDELILLIRTFRRHRARRSLLLCYD